MQLDVQTMKYCSKEL